MPPDIHFDHSSIYLNTGLLPSGPFTVGSTTDITITLLNDGDETGSVDVKLFFGGPTAGSPGGTHLDILPQLGPPGPPIWFDVDPGLTASRTVQWTPNASDFPSTLGASVHGCLFAQTVVKPLAPVYPGDDSALGNWDPTYKLCAQHNIDVVTVAASPSPKPFWYAFGVGHGRGKAVPAELRVEKIAGDDPALLKFLAPMRRAWKLPEAGRVLTAADQGLTLGVERLWVRQTKDKVATDKSSWLRLGHSGLLPATLAKQLAVGKRSKSLKLPLNPGELRQAVVDITPPKGAKPGDVFAVGVANQIAALSTTKRRQLLGTLTLIVQVV